MQNQTGDIDNPRKDKPATKRVDGPQRYHIRDLISKGQEAIIEHAGFDYVLRITRNGKLILTK